MVNRRGVEQAFEQILASPDHRRVTRLAVCMIGLNDCKPLASGCCSRLQAAAGCAARREPAGSVRGDACIVVFQGCSDPSLAVQLDQRITGGLNSMDPRDDLQACIGASVGLALDRDVPQGSLHKAMERAKVGEKGKVVLAPGPRQAGDPSGPRSAMDESGPCCPASPCP